MTIRDKVETFTIQFADVTSNSCQFELSCENTAVRFPIEVEVDAKMEAQIAGLLQDPEKAAHFSYFLQSSGKWLEENGFYEEEISREVAAYGSLVHVFSNYESFRSKADKEPFARGINSIQLLNDGDRWWIVQICWLGESKDLPLPEKYLLKG